MSNSPKRAVSSGSQWMYSGSVSRATDPDQAINATMAVANTWFIRKRALAMSITSGSIALGVLSWLHRFQSLHKN